MSNHMTQPLTEFAAAIIDDGVIDAEEITKIRERIYADGVIDREEADFMFSLNDATSGANNDQGWQGLFVEALTDHVLKDEESPNEIDDDEASYLITKIEADGKIDSNELALLVNIVANAKTATDDFNAFVLSSLKSAVLEDGIIDESEVQMIRSVIYGTGGGAGSDVDRAEADFIFDLNDATSGKDNHSSWKELFVEAIAKHVLEDEESPGEVDEDEGEWLIKRIEGDGKYDENEKALLKNIEKNAKSIPGKLKTKMEMLHT